MNCRALLLLVEDNDIIVDLLMPYFQGHGFTVDAVGSGPSALEKLAEVPYDIIIMDLLVRGASTGVDIARAIRAMPDPRRSIPIIALTGGMIATTVAEMEAAQFAAVIQKPVLPRDLLAAVVNALVMRGL